MFRIWRAGLFAVLCCAVHFAWADAASGGGSDEAPAERVATADENRFDILEYQIEGNTVLSNIAIERAVYPHLGERRTIADVRQAVTALEQAYRDQGYLTVFVDIPEQDVQNGIVRLAVTEGRVDRLKVSGARYYSLGRIKSKTPDLAEGAVPYFPNVEQQVASVNRTPDRRVTPVLRPARVPGRVEVELKVDDRLPFHGSVELNDRYSADTTHTRLSAALRYDNLWQREHSLSIAAQTAPENTSESKVLSLNYLVPLARGDYLAGYYVKSDSDVTTLDSVNAIGKGQIFGLRYIHPLRPQANFSHSLTLGLDHKDFEETTGLTGADTTTHVPISYRALTAGYDITWNEPERTTQFGSNLNFSVRGFGNNDKEFADKRLDAGASYAYLRFDLKHTERFASGWSVLARAAAQAAGSPLISNEQFAAGGADTVRGYTESAALGDHGLVGSVEVRTPSYANKVSDSLDDLRLGAFLDGARLKVLSPLGGQTSSFTLSSAGVGIRFRAIKGLSGTLEWAYPFKTVGRVNAGDQRAHFRVAYEW